MSKGVLARVGASMAALGVAACSAGAPVPPGAGDAAAVGRDAQAFVEAMRPRHAGPPLVAVLALNEGTETTDFLLPHAVLRRAGIAQVEAVAPRAGRVQLMPALQVEIAQDLAGFDRAHPAGADYVIVPAMHVDDDPVVLAWLRVQAGHGARIIGICSGALVLGQAGLLDGRRFTGHWYDRRTLLRRHPGATHLPHRRYLADGDVATTTGITASVPASLALVEAIGGREKAQALAAELGVDSWTPAHDSSPFGLDAARAWSYVLNKAAFWRREHWRVDVHDGLDDIALALAADAWSRTGRVVVEAASPAGPVRLRSGLVLAAQPALPGRPALPLALALDVAPVRQLDRTLCEIASRYGPQRRDWVMQEMEYSSAATACAH